MKPDWWPEWKGETVVIVASGPSAAEVPLEEARGLARFIAINTSWKLAPWADILFACDIDWWKHTEGCPEFAGMKLTVHERVPELYPDVKKVNCRKPDDRIVLDEIGTVGWGGNSGFHCLNLAVQFECRKIILVGYDMTDKFGAHWHGRHPAGLNNPRAFNIERWRRAVDGAARFIRPRGVQVINCSAVSRLTSYPKMSFKEALAA